MKRYKRFMDGIKASDALHQKLAELETPARRPIPWKRYGAVAAALVLVFGLGGYGAWAARVNSRSAPLPSYPAGYQAVPEAGTVGEPDIAPVESGDRVEPVPHIFAGDYDVTKDGITSHYLLPYIEYGEAGVSEAAGQIAADWDIPEGAYRGDMGRRQIAWLLGGEDALTDHLDWDGYELSGWAAWNADGSFWGAYVAGYAGPVDHFEFAVTAGQLPPACVIYPGSVEQNICGLAVTAGKYDGGQGGSRRVSFMKDGCGFRFDLSGTDTELAEKRVSRLVRWVADGSREWTAEELGLTVLGNGTVTCPECGKVFPVGDEKVHAHSCTGAGTAAYNPDESADPGYSASSTYVCELCGKSVPVDGIHFHLIPNGDGTYTCDSCGVTMLEGEKHYHATCEGLPLAPDTHTCEICGKAYPEGTEHSHEMCGLPLAPDTHVCEVCGQTLPAGVEHSHQQEHHQEEHHESHH